MGRGILIRCFLILVSLSSLGFVSSGAVAVPELPAQFVEGGQGPTSEPSAESALPGRANSPVSNEAVGSDSTDGSPESGENGQGEPAASGASSDSQYLSGTGFEWYPDCRAEGLFGEMERIYIKAAVPCPDAEGCPPGTCLVRLGAGQMMFCEAPGRCIRYGVQPANNLGFITLEAWILPNVLNGTFVCPMNEMTYRGDRACGVKYVDLEESSCSGGVSVPNSSQYIHSSECIAPKNMSDPQPLSGSPKNGGSGAGASPGNAGEVSATADSDDSNSEQSGGSCFPANARVLLRGGSKIPMADLQTGDMVHVGNGEYSPVYGFSHRIVGDGSYPFVSIRTKSGAQVRLSPGHFLYKKNSLVAARDVRVGDLLWLAANSLLDEVVLVDNIWDSGLINPHTVQGNIDVDGILCSTLTDAIPFIWLSRLLLAPFSIAFTVFGVSAPMTLEGHSWLGELLRATFSVGSTSLVVSSEL